MAFEKNELFYRNVLVNESDEFIVRASKGYGTVVEIVVEGDLTETTIRISAALGKALADAGDVALRS